MCYVSSAPWITHVRRMIRRKNATHAKVKSQVYLSIFLYVFTPEGDIRRLSGNQVLGVSFLGSAKIRVKYETLRREIKADMRKQHDLYVNNLVGDVKANPKDI